MNKFIVPIIAFVCIGFYVSFSSSEEVSYEPRTYKFPISESWKGGAEYMYMLKRNPETGLIPLKSVLEARENTKSFAASGKTDETFTWEEMGPDNIGGRTRAIIIDKTVEDGSRMYAGSVSGGLFVSNNAAANWQPVTLQQENSGVSCLAQATDGTIWIGTGSTFEWASGSLGSGGSGFVGNGTYKLTPGSTEIEKVESASPGTSNAQSNDEWSGVNDIKINQSTGRIYIGQNKGLRYSDDNGSTWVNPISLNNGQPNTSTVDDIELANDGTVLVALDGVCFVSPNGNEGTFTLLNSSVGLKTSARIELAMSEIDNNICWATTSNSQGECKELFKSTDKGYTWTEIPQTADFNFCRDQGWYNLLLAPSPTDVNTVYLGGIDLYKYDGAWTHLSQWDAFQFAPFYVHADQHGFVNSKSGVNRTFFTNDGGIFSTTDGGEQFIPMNRGYNVTQFYTVAYSEQGLATGGAQDNGTILVGLGGIYPLEGNEVSGGDGFGTDISNITNKVFVTSQQGNVRRGTDNGGFGAFCEPWNCEDNGFSTAVRLWETYESETSKDSILFRAEDGSTDFVLKSSNGISKNFDGIVPKVQESGVFQFGTIVFTAGSQEVNDPNQDGILEGDGTGTFDYSTGEYSVQFNTPPSQGINFKVNYALAFNPGSSISLQSLTPEVSFRGTPFKIDHVLTDGLQPGDSVKVQDPIQSLFGFGAADGTVYLTRDGLRDGSRLWWPISTNSGRIKTMEFSPEGNHLFIASFTGNLIRISGLNNLYKEGDDSQLVITKIYDSPSPVTGIAIDPNDANNMIITTGSYGRDKHVFRTTEATTTTAQTSFVDIQGDLPPMPVYDAIIGNDDAKTILVGTEFGIYKSSISTLGEWTSANTGLPLVPVHELRQQTNPFKVTDFEGVIYAGTHGRGIWKSSALLSSKQISSDFADNTFTSDLTVFPNPSSVFENTFVRFEVSKRTNAVINVFNIQGQRVFSTQRELVSGDNQVILSGKFDSGNYFVVVEAEGQTKVGKFIVAK